MSAPAPLPGGPDARRPAESAHRRKTARYCAGVRPRPPDPSPVPPRSSRRSHSRHRAPAAREASRARRARGTDAASAPSSRSGRRAMSPAECARRPTTSRVLRSRRSTTPGPESTSCVAVFTAATDTSGSRCGVISSSLRFTASMAPGGHLLHQSARARRRAPARRPASRRRRGMAATYSPMLWPIIASGTTPQAIHSCASAYSTANSAGCASAVCCSAARPLPVGLGG